MDGCSVSSSYSISTCRRLRRSRLASTSLCSSPSSVSSWDDSCFTSYSSTQQPAHWPAPPTETVNQSIERLLVGLSSGTTARSTGDSQLNVQQVVRKRLPEQMCLEEATKCRQWFCWCHVFREVIPCLQAGDRKSSATNSWQSASRHYITNRLT